MRFLPRPDSTYVCVCACVCMYVCACVFVCMCGCVFVKKRRTVFPGQQFNPIRGLSLQKINPRKRSQRYIQMPPCFCQGEHSTLSRQPTGIGTQLLSLPRPIPPLMESPTFHPQSRHRCLTFLTNLIWSTTKK